MNCSDSRSAGPDVSTPIAIVGAGCRLPACDDLDQFWRLLVSGRSAAGAMPRERLDANVYFDAEKGCVGKTYSLAAATMRFESPDAALLGLDSATLASADLGHLSFCMTVARAFKHAGYDPQNLLHRRAGVYVGHTRGSDLGGSRAFATGARACLDPLLEVAAFRDLDSKAAETQLNVLARNIAASVPGFVPGQVARTAAKYCAALVSRAFGLTGPCMALNAACASSLQGLAMAARALELGKIDMAVVGGASYASWDTMVLFSKAQSVTAGDSRPFDAAADGLLAAEGHVVVILKTLDRALRDGDRVLAVVRGIGVSSDGRGKSLWAPRVEGQVKAIQRAYGEHIDPAGLQFIEAHATSTQVGDATEFRALLEALGPRLQGREPIPIGSVKANIGHTLETAGLAGLLKTVLAMQHGEIPRQIHVEQLNPKIDWDNAPYFVPTHNLPWNPSAETGTRLAAVNAFGIGGLNVHVVLESLGEASAVTGRGAVPNRRGRVESVETSEKSPRAQIAIVGAGLALPGAQNLAEWNRLLNEGIDPKSEVRRRWRRDHSMLPPALRERIPIRGGFQEDYQYDWKKFRIPPKEVARANPLQFMILQAVDDALAMAGLREGEFDRDRTAVIVGSDFVSDFSTELQWGLRLPELKLAIEQNLAARGVSSENIAAILAEYEERFLVRYPALLDETGSFTSSTLASRITKVFDLHGGAVALDAGSASSGAAIAAACDLLQTGGADFVICATGQRSMGLRQHETLLEQGVALANHPRSPLDEQGQRPLPAEGAVVFVLQRLPDAQSAGRDIHAVVDETRQRIVFDRGSRNSSDDAENDAKSELPALVEAVPTGNVELDRAWWISVGRFGAESPATAMPVVNTLVAQVGHLGGASGAAAALALLHDLERGESRRGFLVDKPAAWLAPATVAMSHTSTPPGRDVITADNVGCVVELDESGIAAETWLTRHPSELTSEIEISPPQSIDVTTQVKTSQATLLPLPARQLTAASPSSRRFRILRFCADDRANLAAIIRGAAEQPLAAIADAGFADAGFADESSRDESWRLAVVVDTEESHSARLTTIAKLIESAAPDHVLESQAAYLGQNSAKPHRVALLFPGQGSQYGGMLDHLLANSHVARQTVAEIDEVMQRLGFPTAYDIICEQAEALGRDVWRTQTAMLITETVFLRVLQSFGIPAHRVSGHSFGEFAALIAAGCWSFEAAMRATDVRCRAIEDCEAAQGGMLSTNAPVMMVERFCCDLPGSAFPSNYNAPDQTVASGDYEAIKLLKEQLRAAGADAQTLDVPAPFHTPLMKGVQEPMRRGLDGLRLEPPTTPILSSVNNRYVAEPQTIVDNLIEQLTMPVRYVDLIRRLWDEGVDRFVEVGPKRVLTQLNRRILADVPARLLATDHRTLGPWYQMHCVRAALEVDGLIDDAEQFEDTAQFDETAPPTTESQSQDTLTNKPRSTPEWPTLADASNLFKVLQLRGTAGQIGTQFGKLCAPAIRKVLRACADRAMNERPGWPDVNAAARDASAFFDAEALSEIDAMAEAVGVNRESLIALNLRLYPDLGGGCTHFAIAPRSGATLVHAANHDKPLALHLPGLLTRAIQVRSPHAGLRSVLFGCVGEVGGINGFNEAGLTVTSAMLLDLPRNDAGARGVLHGILVRKILSEARTLEQSLDIVRSNRAAGAWALCVSERDSGRVGCIEYDGPQVAHRFDLDRFLGTNHAQFLSPRVAPPSHSLYRFERLTQQLDAAECTPAVATKILRDRFDCARGKETRFPTMNTIARVDNQMSLVVAPQESRFLCTAGPASGGDENQFFEAATTGLWKNFEASIDDTCMLPDQLPSSPASTTSVDSGVLSPEDWNRQLADDGFAAGRRADRVCQRFEPQVMPADLSVSGVSRLTSGTTCILGAQQYAAPIADRLRAAGIKAIDLDAAHLCEPRLESIEQEIAAHAPQHLILCGALDADALGGDAPDAWQARLERNLLPTFTAVQVWYRLALQSGTLGQSTLLATTRLGGDFGLTTAPKTFEGGCYSGLLKAVFREAKVYHSKQAPCVKVVDFDEAIDTATITERLLAESTAHDGEVEIAYRKGQRFVVRPRLVNRKQTDAQVDSSQLPRGVWIVSGGARGVTAAVARRMATEFGLRLHLLGSSPVPEINPDWAAFDDAQLKELRGQILKDAVAKGQVPIQAWKRVEKAIEIHCNLRAFETAGVAVTYHVCDVTSADEVRRVLAEIRRTDGPIRGLIHGAGVEAASRLEKKKLDSVRATLDVKVGGMLQLFAALDASELEHVMAFGSTSGRFGGVGQADYSLANDLLAKVIDWLRGRHPHVRGVCMHWPAWDEVGMAARPESRVALEAAGLKFLPLGEGLDFAANEFRFAASTSETLISEWDYMRRFHGPAEIAAELAPPTSRDAKRDERRSPDFPLIKPESLVASPDNTAWAANVSLDPLGDPFLAEHRLKQRPIMPLAMLIEALVETAYLAAPERAGEPLEITQAMIQEPLRFLHDRPTAAKIALRAAPNGFHAQFTSDLVNRRGVLLKPGQVNLSANLSWSRERVAPTTNRHDAHEWFDIEYLDRDAPMYHGPPLRGLSRLRGGGGFAQGTVDVRPLVELSGKRPGGCWAAHPALLDACFFACGVVLWLRNESEFGIPRGVRRLWFSPRIPSPQGPCVVHLAIKGIEDSVGQFDFTLADAEGNLLLAADGYEAFLFATAKV